MDETAQVESEADFSTLPDVTWVQILQHLPLIDRYHVSITCRALNEVFNHPSLWHSQTLHLFGDSSDFSDPCFKSNVIGPFFHLTKHFGKYFQNLTLKVSGHLFEIDDKLQDLLLEVGKQCRLEKLTIDVGVIISDFHKIYIAPPSLSAILALTSFVKSAYRMRHLHIQSWPLYEEIDNEECNIFKAMVCNDKLKQLETLTLFMVDGKGWSERTPCLISAEETLAVLSHYKNLTHIGLRTPMLKESILHMLASAERSKLERLDIFIHYLDPVRSRKPQFAIPVVSSSTWKALHNRCLDFQVNLTIFLRVSHMELANMLQPEVPISSVTYMKYCGIDPATLTLLYNHNNNTLASFHSYCDSYDLDQELLQLVTKCTNLVEFVYYGDIKVTTVVQLAKARGDKWKKFAVLRDKIKVPDEFEDVDENQVLAPNREGNLVLVSLMRHHRPVEDVEQSIDDMAAEVSVILGHTWQPDKAQ